MTKTINKKYEEDLDFLKCHIFRLSQKKWKMTKEKCLNTFIKNKLFDYIDDNYEFMHTQGLDRSVLDIERVVRK